MDKIGEDHIDAAAFVIGPAGQNLRRHIPAAAQIREQGAVVDVFFGLEIPVAQKNHLKPADHRTLHSAQELIIGELVVDRRIHDILRTGISRDTVDNDNFAMIAKVNT